MSDLNRVLAKGFSFIAELGAQVVEIPKEKGLDAVEFSLDNPKPYGVYGTGLEAELLKDLVSVLSIPVGVSLNSDREVSVEDWEELVSAGIEFVDMMAHRFPAFILTDDRVGKIVGVGSGYVLEQITKLSELDGIGAVRVLLTPSRPYDLELTVFDLATLSLVVERSSKPVLISTKKSISPSELPLLAALGCKGIVIRYEDAERLELYRSSLASRLKVSPPAPSDT